MKRRTGRTVLVASLLLALAGAVVIGSPPAIGQSIEDPGTLFRVEVDLVLLNVAVTDRRGRYVRDLNPSPPLPPPLLGGPSVNGIANSSAQERRR